jgi:DNA-binding protein H-NS
MLMLGMRDSGLEDENFGSEFPDAVAASSSDIRKIMAGASVASEPSMSRSVSRRTRESPMLKPDLAAMPFDELLMIHEELTKILSDKIIAEKRELAERLAKLNRVELINTAENADPLPTNERTPRRKYPKVLPKYCNPLAPSETWAGRGKQPRWLVAALKTGRKLDEFKIDNKTSARKNRPQRSQHS